MQQTDGKDASTQKACSKHATSTQQACSKHTASTKQARSKHAASTQQAQIWNMAVGLSAMQKFNFLSNTTMDKNKDQAFSPNKISILWQPDKRYQTESNIYMHD